MVATFLGSRQREMFAVVRRARWCADRASGIGLAVDLKFDSHSSRRRLDIGQRGAQCGVGEADGQKGGRGGSGLQHHASRHLQARFTALLPDGSRRPHIVRKVDDDRR